MGPWEACAADKNGQAIRRDEENRNTWMCWESGGHRGCDLSHDLDVEDRGMTPEIAEAFTDWRPLDPIDAVTLLGALGDT